MRISPYPLVMLIAVLAIAVGCRDDTSDGDSDAPMDTGSAATSNQTSDTGTPDDTDSIADTAIQEDTAEEDTSEPDTAEPDTAQPDLGLPEGCTWPGVAEPDDLATPELYTPRWAFEPWISKDISDGPDTYAFVDGFIDRDIPVGAVVLDSPWETQYNTFIPNEERYPDFDQMIVDMHARDVKVVLWITQMI
ncbi:MAG: TIM-barrel domain-containing protein, partial [Myxococcota bacterium]